MRAKTEELLYLMLWTCDAYFRPSWRNLGQSFEGWAYSKGLHPRLAELERRLFIEERNRLSGRPKPDARVYRLTNAGRLHALGGRDPEAWWGRPWDGHWRLALYDVPSTQDKDRKKLRRYLIARGFGYLQNSVWISPDPFSQERSFFGGAAIDVESFILMEARPCAGESDQDIVAGAWDFQRINRAYDKHEKVLKEFPDGALKTEESAKLLQRWARRERTAWLDAITQDPLLPQCLHPASYLGQKSWQARLKTLAQAAEQTQDFQPMHFAAESAAWKQSRLNA